LVGAQQVSGFIIGVDGGGTRTQVLVCDEAGTEVTSFDAEGSAIRPHDVSRSAHIIVAAVRSALLGVPEAAGNVKALSVGVAGAGRRNQRDALTSLLSQADVADEVFVEADAAMAMEDAFGEGPGILLIAGTGSVAFGRSPTGVFARCGGWGATCGDEGSGYWLGRRALSAVTAAADGREPDTALTGAVLTAVQANDVDDLIGWAAAADVAQIASLASSVLQTAAGGDLRAGTLVMLAAEELMLHVRTLGRKLFVDERAAMEIALSGGLLARGSLLRKRLEHRMKTVVPGAQLRQEDVRGARGAVRMARRLVAMGAR
jgi:glucosamine kinase